MDNRLLGETMPKKQLSLVAVFILLAAQLIMAGAPEELVEQLQPLSPFVNQTWKSKPSAANQERPVIDVMRGERAMNGKAVRILHSVNDGEYGGETIIMWDAQKKSLVYFYFTTAGFYTQGTMSLENGKVTSHEYVTGNKNKITEVKSVGEWLADGSWKTQAYYFHEGKWEEGHSFTYAKDPGAEVKFK
jgi:hypothetical protein